MMSVPLALIPVPTTARTRLAPTPAAVDLAMPWQQMDEHAMVCVCG